LAQETYLDFEINSKSLSSGCEW